MAGDPTNPAEDAVARQMLFGIASLATALRSNAWRDARARGLTPTQSQILGLLGAHGTPLRLNEVALALRVSPATASDAVSTLVTKQLVLKKRDRRDSRSVALSLTEAGTAQARLSAEWPESLLSAMQQLTPEEQATFLKSLAKMLQSLQERGEISIARICPGDRELRTECIEHEPLDTEGVKHSWEQQGMELAGRRFEA